MKFCGEIQYENSSGWTTHSDICWRCGAPAQHELTPEYRAFLHTVLDEWLDRSNGTGFLWLGNTKDIVDNFNNNNKEDSK
jgi:hypothetical protein